ncbi:MAG: hypothetical protein HRF50_08970 [Phycisphaerae bacterium]|jgi:hypothetical protein
MIAQLETFGQNIVLLLGLLFCSVTGFILLVAAWTFSKILVWKLRQYAHTRAARRVVYDEDGQPLPPVFRGACTACGVVFATVYQMPDGRMLCARCRRLAKQATRADAHAGEEPEAGAGRE